MARIKSLARSNKPKRSDTEVMGFYKVQGEEFFLWSLKSGDEAVENTKQHISFNKEIAQQLYSVLGEYLKK